jgi:hypothetical protein
MLLMALLACGQGELDIRPNAYDWGEINFLDEECLECECDDHCGPIEIELTNIGDAPLVVELPEGYDGDRFCLKGFDDPDAAITLPDLGPDETYLLELAICGYLPGEQTLNLAGQIGFRTDGVNGGASFEWAYVPIRDQSSE